MEKVTINNQVVLMRKFVKQAKIRAINGYTKEIRKLQNRKGSDDATSKFKRKAERLLQKVAILRKIHPDAVSRKALAKEKDWKAVLKEKNIPLEDQCYALLANYAAVQTEVERFHKKYWDLVPKLSTFFKDWEEKNKDPRSNKKKAKQLRKNMKNVKLDNPNAISVGSTFNTDTIKSKSSLNKNEINGANSPSQSTVTDTHQNKNKFSGMDSTPMHLSVAKLNKITSNDTINQKQIKPVENVLGNKECSEVEERSSDAYNSCENSSEDEVNSDHEMNSDKEPNSHEEEISDQEMNSDEGNEKVLSQEMNSDKEGFCKGPLKFKYTASSESKINGDFTKNTEDNENSDSENSDLKDDAVSESDKDINEAKNDEPMPTTKDSGDIRTRLQALAENKLKSDFKRKKLRPVQEKKTKKTVQVKKQKAVAMINLNELLGLDEFSVEKANDAVEETVEKKQSKKDPFFLGKDGEVISESEDEDSPRPFSGQDRPAFKKKTFEDFSKPSKGDLFKKRSFSDRPGLKGKDFPRNQRNSEYKNQSFKSRERQSLNGKDFSKGDLFKRRSFSDKPGFKGKDFPRDQKNSENKNQSFKSRERQSLNGKDFSRKQNSSNFEDRNNSFKNRQERRFQQNKSFGEKIPKKFKSDPYVAPRNKDNFVKNKMNNPANKSLVDDKPLHPSWEAKRKLKEAAASKATFQGKRIVFDD